MPFPAPGDPVPEVDTAQMIEVDRAMIEDYGIGLIQMMENAGRNLAHLARVRFLEGNPRGRRLIVLAGTGGNGGGALVCARHLHNWGARVQVLTARPDDAFGPVPAHQLAIVRRLGIAVSGAPVVPRMAGPALIVDGLIGYSLQGAPRGGAAVLIRWANEQPAPILSLDAPSGMDTGTGRVYEPAIRATVTMTLALPKVGLRADAAVKQVGELYLADISVPPGLYRSPALGLDVKPIFAGSEILRLR